MNWLQHTPFGITVSVWGLCALVWAAYAAVQAAGRYVDRRHAARRRHDADVRAALVYRDAMWDDQGHLAMWEREMENER